jgi:hypothetical protein
MIIPWPRKFMPSACAADAEKISWLSCDQPMIGLRAAKHA